ncbi:MAG: NAD(P)/FAD-dependent oxidoreductase [Defluviitaleaceae bacterium]|nr:NAD(P)/FAD-dependent oxidoreductase [Defluviitaleaceae bacterium]
MRVGVVGGGAAGMLAAATAAENGASVILLEKNEKLGKKLYITGKGRCNITNDTDVQGLLAHVLTNPRFLNSAFYNFDSRALMGYEAFKGVPFKTERGGRVFPESDKADDINKALEQHLRGLNVKIKLNTAVKKIAAVENAFEIVTSGRTERVNAVIIATGGLSYPSTGSTGDGYAFARGFSHAVTDVYPSLVPLITAEKWVADLEGLSLKNVRCIAKISGKIVYEETGEMLFTHSGVSGPIILRASAFLCSRLQDKPIITIDLKPALTHEQLDARILRDFSQIQNRNFINALDALLPKRLIETVVSLSEIPPEKKVNTITRAERLVVVNILKGLTLTPTATAGFKEAIITKGGVDVREINPSSLMSKKQAGVFFAGEVLDVDAMTGGFNLQIAFSTGRLAGLGASRFCRID